MKGSKNLCIYIENPRESIWGEGVMQNQKRNLNK